jgi:hypothetical protein
MSIGTQTRFWSLPFAFRWLAICVLAVTVVSGQTLLNDPKKIADAQELFDTMHSGQLPCEITPRKPHFIFSLRMQAGYVAHVPLADFRVQGQKWIVLTRVTSKERNGNPVYLSDVVELPRGGNSQHEAMVQGSYWLGEGRYSVDFLMFDDAGDVCRKEWEVDARLNSGVRNVKPILPPGAVAGNSVNELPVPAAKPVGRVTILLHAASLLQRQSSLRDLDKAMFLDAMVALMEEMPARPVRLVVFNLEQQRELSRKDGFTLDDLPEVSRELDAIRPSAVDYSVLRSPAGPVDRIRNLVNQELHAPEPSDAVIFLGPRSIYKDKPSPPFGLPPTAKPKFFYLLWEQPPVGSGLRFGPGLQGQVGRMGGTDPFAGTMHGDVNSPAIINSGPNHGPDSIAYTVDQLKGKTIKVDSVESFASAVAEIARLSGMNQ